MVRKEGFEPPRPFGHKILSLARLPVPPLPQVDSTFIIYVVVQHGYQVEAGEGPDLPAIAGSYIGESVLVATAAAFTRIKFVSSLKKWRCPEAPEVVGSALIL